MAKIKKFSIYKVERHLSLHVDHDKSVVDLMGLTVVVDCGTVYLQRSFDEYIELTNVSIEFIKINPHIFVKQQF